MTVVVFGRKLCYACKATEHHLARLAIPYLKRDVDTDTEAREAVQHSGRAELPLVEVHRDGKIIDFWHGLRVERIEELAK